MGPFRGQRLPKKSSDVAAAQVAGTDLILGNVVYCIMMHFFCSTEVGVSSSSRVPNIVVVALSEPHWLQRHSRAVDQSQGYGKRMPKSGDVRGRKEASAIPVLVGKHPAFDAAIQDKHGPMRGRKARSTAKQAAQENLLPRAKQ